MTFSSITKASLALMVASALSACNQTAAPSPEAKQASQSQTKQASFEVSKISRFVNDTSGSSSIAVADKHAYITYTDSADYLGKIVKVNIETGEVERSEQTFFTIGDGDRSHNDSAMAIDGDGFVHVWIGMHNHQMRYYRSNAPYSIESFTNLSNSNTWASYDDTYNDWQYIPTPADGNKTYYSHIKKDQNKNSDIRLYSYPHAVSLANGDIAIILRRAGIDLNGVNGSIRDINFNEKQDFYYYDHKLKTWTEYELLQQQGKNAYMSKLYADKDSNVHIVTAWSQLHRGGNTFQRGTYLKFNSQNKTFHRADGKQVDYPLAADDPQMDHFYEWSGTWGDKTSEIQTPQVTLNSDGYPVVTYPYNINGFSQNNPLWVLRVSHFNGEKWVSTNGLDSLRNYNRPPLTNTSGMINIFSADLQKNVTIHQSKDGGKTFDQFKLGKERYPFHAIQVDATTDVFLSLNTLYKVVY
ncbi:BNR-4 repeat-containing protein [Paraferrimonas sp. SM1919]|uniref:BNR-4 repeat-containing protein n=1 Tax=Paraferrimonas sp. SM1919 TaxID=2662263 RepID=UPI0013D4BACC|nr:BNR-4 repeat-containing protein [Paraferrimonas sp. SM1919]